jgi:orotate phosphoribosyltransferase
MTARMTRLSWTDAEITRLRELSAKGASVVRAAAALNRTTNSVKRASRLHGIQLVGQRELKAAIRALDSKGALSAR